jgi:hypothetical protein
MVLITPEDVAGIVQVDEDTWSDLTPPIEAAEMLLAEVCGASGYADPTLSIIGRWLAAHFYAVMDPQSTYEQAGPVSVKFESQVDLGLNLTRYGQQAMVLDYKGNLAKLNATTLSGKTKARIQMLWLGKTREELAKDGVPL